MSEKSHSDKPILGITMGDPAGIGPEIAVKAFTGTALFEQCKPIVIGDAKVISHYVGLLNAELNINGVQHVSAARFKPGWMDVLDLDLVDLDALRFGTVSAMSGNAAFHYVRTAIELALSGALDATVTGPLNKESLNLAKHHFSGHTEIYAQLTGTKRYAMLLADDHLRVIHVSTHVSLLEACRRVKRDRIVQVISLLHDACKQFGIDHPQIAVAGLNPHCGESGLFGQEESQEIIPAVNEAQSRGFNVVGPVPADSLFAKAKTGAFDGCVAMYHDQGHIPFKFAGFQWNQETQTMSSVRGVNITLGLPIIRTSVDHGTAFEIAGKGVASADALLLAIEYAVKLARYQKANQETKD